MSREARERSTQWIVSRCIDTICKKSSGTLLSVEELRYLMRQPFIRLISRNFHPHGGTFVRYRHSAKRGDTGGVAWRCSSFKRGDYAAIFAD